VAVTGSDLVADVDLRGRIISDQDDGQAGPDPVLLLQLQDALLLFFLDLRGNGLAIYDSCAHH
jgi:hypothetical protein